MIFDDIAKALSDAYTRGYLDRDTALKEFGRDRRKQLKEMVENGRSLEDLAQAAEIGPASHWAKVIERGMKD